MISREEIERIIDDFQTKQAKSFVNQQKFYQEKEYELSSRADVRVNTFEYAIARLQELLEKEGQA